MSNFSSSALPIAPQLTAKSVSFALATDDAQVASIITALALGTQIPLLTSGVSNVASTFVATGTSASFTPLAGRGFYFSLWGTFVGSVQLERSFDSGTNWLPITAGGIQLFKWSAPASETDQMDKTGVLHRLNCTAYTSGTINYMLCQ